jgi:hypothetical protein
MSSGHVITWFELPVADLDRASRFYAQVLGVELHIAADGPMRMAILPAPLRAESSASARSVHGALVQGPGYEPGPGGTLLYLDAGRDLAPMLARVEPAGGRVVKARTAIGEHGFIAQFIDTEGNRVALHSPE